MNEAAIHLSGAGSFLRSKRKQAQVTLKELSEKTGIAKATLSRQELGTSTVSDREIQSIANALRLKAEDLLRECLLFVRPRLNGSPLRKLLKDLLMEKQKPRRPGAIPKR